MEFSDMELAIIEHALRSQAQVTMFDVVAFRKDGENDAADVAERRARHARELADKIANRF